VKMKGYIWLKKKHLADFEGMNGTEPMRLARGHHVPARGTAIPKKYWKLSLPTVKKGF
jgi:hypothetical protein